MFKLSEEIQRYKVLVALKQKLSLVVLDAVLCSEDPLSEETGKTMVHFIQESDATEGVHGFVGCHTLTRPGRSTLDADGWQAGWTDRWMMPAQVFASLLPSQPHPYCGGG